MFAKLDLFLLDRIFNPLNIWLYKRFDWNNFTAAKLLIMFGTAVLLVLVFCLLSSRITVLDPITVTLMCALEFWWAFEALRTAVSQESKWKNPKPGMLPENLRDAPRKEVTTRRFFLSVVGIVGLICALLALFNPRIGMVDVYRIASWLPILIGFYFLACTPPGPRERRERGFVDNLKQSKSSI